MTPLATLKRILAESFQPSTRDETPHYAFCIACAHVLLGASAAFVASLMTIPWGMGLVWVPILFWIFKEAGDLGRGGSAVDGLIDTLMIFLGFLIFGQAAFAPLTLLSALLGAILGGLRLRT